MTISDLRKLWPFPLPVWNCESMPPNLVVNTSYGDFDQMINTFPYRVSHLFFQKYSLNPLDR